MNSWIKRVLFLELQTAAWTAWGCITLQNMCTPSPPLWFRLILLLGWSDSRFAAVIFAKKNHLFQQFEKIFRNFSSKFANSRIKEYLLLSFVIAFTNFLDKVTIQFYNIPLDTSQPPTCVPCSTLAHTSSSDTGVRKSWVKLQSNFGFTMVTAFHGLSQA